MGLGKALEEGLIDGCKGLIDCSFKDREEASLQSALLERCG